MSGNEQYFKNSMERVKHLWRCGENRSALMLLERLRSMIDVEDPRLADISGIAKKINAEAVLGDSVDLALRAFEAGRYRDGLSLAREALELGENPRAWLLIGLCRKMLNESDAALDAFSRALALDPEYHEARIERSGLLWDLGRADAADADLNRVLRQDPENAFAWSHVGIRKFAAGDYRGCIEASGKAVSLNPDLWSAHYNIAQSYFELKEPKKALPHYEEAIKGSPDNKDILFQLGVCCLEVGNPAAAVDLFLRYVELVPANPGGIYNLGLALRDSGQKFEAVKVLEDNMRYLDQSAEAHFVLGGLYRELGSFMRAMERYERAIRIDPNHRRAKTNLGFLCADLTDFDRCVALTKSALEGAGDVPEARSNLLFFSSYDPSFTAESLALLIRDWSDRFAEPLRPRSPMLGNSLDSDRKPRVGFVSPDFRNHVSARFLYPLFENRDADAYEAVFYPELGIEDEYTEHYRTLCDAWYPTGGMKNAEVTRMIRGHEIDILVDLGGHCGANRLLAFAGRAAPVQVTWLGYGNTSGLNEMDYFIGDNVLAPREYRRFFSESVYAMPGAFMCYRPYDSAIEVGPPPARKNGFVTFGSMSRTIRYNRRVRRLWAKILARVPNARLLLFTPTLVDPAVVEYMGEKFRADGLDPDRIDMRADLDWWPAYNDVDIALDPFPQNNGTITFDTLWMGNPIVTLKDRPPVGRLGASILTQMKLFDWIAEDEEQYVDIAVDAANDLDRVERLRGSLRSRMEASPLRDEKRFARDMEAMFADVWRRYLADPKFHGRET